MVWTWRKILTGRGGCPLIAREFSQLCGDDAAEVLATFCTFLRVLAHAGDRRFQIGYPGSAVLTSDERQFLILIAVAQAGDEPRFEGYLRSIARAELRPALAIAARALGTALEMHNLQLPLAIPIDPSAPSQRAKNDDF